MSPKNKLSLEQINEKAKSVHGNEYSIIEVELKGYNRKVTIKHNKCNRQKIQTLHRFLAGAGCQYCNGGRPRMSRENLEEKFYSIHDKGEWNLGIEVEPYVYPSNGLKQRQFVITHKICGGSKAVPTNCFTKRKVGCFDCRFEENEGEIK